MAYISEEQISIRFRRYRALNAARLKKALSVMSYDARLCLSVVPVLLHYNHSCLPGYRKGYVPHGIDMFVPDGVQRRYLSECLADSVDPLEEPQQRDILALYAMGSTSSVGQGKGSDLDLWVCIRNNLSTVALRALTEKCSLISTYAKAYGVELNLFVTSEDRFTNFHPDSLDEENCGSAQNIFLLDEFYRTCIRLCGRYIIWFMVSSKEERADYQGYVNYLLYRKLKLTVDKNTKHAYPCCQQKTVGDASFSEKRFVQSVILMRFMVRESLIGKIEQEIAGQQEPSELNYTMFELLMAHQALCGMVVEEEGFDSRRGEERDYNSWHDPVSETKNVSSVGDDFIMKSILTAVMNMTKTVSQEAEEYQDFVENKPENNRPDIRQYPSILSIPSYLLSDEPNAEEEKETEKNQKTKPPLVEATAKEHVDEKENLSAKETILTWPHNFNELLREAGGLVTRPMLPWLQPAAKAIRENLRLRHLMSAMGVSPTPVSMMTYLNMQRIPESMRVMHDFLHQRYMRTEDTESDPIKEKDWRIFLMKRAILYALNIDNRISSGSYSEKRSQKVFALNPNEWFDFGMVVKSSPAEYFGSGLWLLYKAIDSPFKVVLKILLMETYSFDYPNTLLLSSELKDYMLSHDGYNLRLDAYYLMYLRVSHYLRFHADHSRLTLMRKCFYIKIFMGLNDRRMYSNADYSFRRDLLDGFCQRWGWTPDFVHELEQVATWKINDVRTFNEEVYSSLIESYRTLLNFSIRQGIEYAITSDDAGVLSRKLYATFESYPGKIILLHSSFSHNIEERHLCFIHPSAGSLCRGGWHLYAASPDNPNILNTKVSYVAHRLCTVVAWACFNGLLTPRTLLHTAGKKQPIAALKIRQLGSDISRILMAKRPHVNEKTLMRIRRLCSCIVVLNLEKDETALAQNRLLDIDIGSTLSCGRQHICLVGSVDLVLINSWGEIRSIALPEGEDGVVELLATLVRIIGNSSISGDEAQELLSSVEVCSYADVNQDLIKYDVEFILHQVFSCMRTNGSSEFVFEVGRGTYIARDDEERGVTISKRSSLGSNEFEARVLCRYGMRPEYSIQVPPLVDRYATAGIVQYFFSPKQHGCWDIYIINERNSVEIVHNYVGSRADLVNKINREYTDGNHEKQRQDAFFNLPQYFVLSPDLSTIHPFTISGQ